VDAFWAFYVDRLRKCSLVEQVTPAYHRRSTGAIPGQATWLAEWAVCVVSEPARDSLTSVELGLSVRKGRADAYG